MKIRKARFSDVNRIYEIGKDEFKKTGWGYWFTKDNLRHLISEQAELCWVLEINDRVEGAHFVLEEWDKNVWGWVILISKPFRQKGYGTLLFEETIKMLKKRHYQKMFADVAVGDIPSLKWHKRLGFKRLGIFEDWLGKGKDAIIFSVDI